MVCVGYYPTPIIAGEMSSEMRKTRAENLYEVPENMYNSFNEIPDPSPLPEKKIFWRQCKPSSKAFSKSDLRAMRHEERLRFEYDCSEAIPGKFDPEKLEADFQSRYNKSNTGNQDLTTAAPGFQSQDDEIVELNTGNEGIQKRECVPDRSAMYFPDRGSCFDCLDFDGEFDGELDEYDNEGVIYIGLEQENTQANYGIESNDTMTGRSVPDSSMRRPTPRIKTGSKPPLSRSAFSRAGLPSPKEGSSKSTTLRKYPKAPRYFPFKSKVRNG